VEGLIMLLHASITEEDKKSKIHLWTGSFVLSAGFFAAMCVLKFFVG
jgi:hypothetical protein